MAIENYDIDKNKLIMNDLMHDGLLLQKMDDDIRNTPIFIVCAMCSNPQSFKFAGPDIVNKAIFAKKALLTDGLLLEFCSQDLQDDFELVKLAILKNPNALAFASQGLQNNDELKTIVSNVTRLSSPVIENAQVQPIPSIPCYNITKLNKNIFIELKDINFLNHPRYQIYWRRYYLSETAKMSSFIAGDVIGALLVANIIPCQTQIWGILLIILASSTLLKKIVDYGNAIVKRHNRV